MQILICSLSVALVVNVVNVVNVMTHERSADR